MHHTRAYRIKMAYAWVLTFVVLTCAGCATRREGFGGYNPGSKSPKIVVSVQEQDTSVDRTALVSPSLPIYTHFPFEMARAGIRGQVLVKVDVDPTGKARGVKLLEASQLEFVGPAIEAISKSQFVPAVRAGAAAESWTIIRVEFTFEDER